MVPEGPQAKTMRAGKDKQTQAKTDTGRKKTGKRNVGAEKT